MRARELPSDDLYAELGVPENATFELIDERYRALAKLFHPDRNPGDPRAEDRFKRISAANRILGDPVKRAEYDAYRLMMAPTTMPRPPLRRPQVAPGKGIRKRRFPKWVRITIATLLIVSGLAVMLWRIVAQDGADAPTNVTLWIMGIKLFVVGVIAACLPFIRAVWEHASRA
jgi:hypothetical protein